MAQAAAQAPQELLVCKNSLVLHDLQVVVVFSQVTQFESQVVVQKFFSVSIS